MAERIAFVGDVHIGNHKKFGGVSEKGINERCRMVLDTLRATYMTCATEDVDTVVLLGDLFDSPRVSPQIIAEVQNVISTIPTVILCGNHDQFSDAEGDNALGPLSPVADIFDAPDVISIARNVDLILVPYQKGKCKDWLSKHTEELLKESHSSKKILAFHAGIFDEKTPRFLKDADAAIASDDLFDLCKKGKILHAFAGHWHNRKTWGYYDASSGDKYISVQAGALVPTGWNNPGMEYGVVYVYDSKKASLEHLCIPGPRFLSATLDDDIGLLRNDYPYSNEKIKESIKVFLKMKVSEADSSLAATIIEAGKKSGAIADGEVDFYSDETEKINSAAAKATRSSKTLDEALDNYTSSMRLKKFREIAEKDFDEEEARTTVRESAKDYMKVSDAY